VLLASICSGSCWTIMAGLKIIERAIRSNPNYARAYNFRGLLRAWNGGSDAAADFELAMRLSPRDPFNYNAKMGLLSRITTPAGMQKRPSGQTGPFGPSLRLS